MIPLSVVIATTHPWPELRMTLTSLWDQLQTAGGELVIADGDGRGLPDDFAERFPGVVYLTNPGASIFVLRSMGMQHSQGEIVAVTEDHCRIASNWCASILASHRRHPDAAVVSGVVENGSKDRLIDWANFFMAHGPMMGPMPDGPSDNVTLSNAAFKRYALPKDAPSSGVMEMLYIRDLQRSGGKFYIDNATSVDHVQSHGFWNTFAVHYHNGRAIAGYRRSALRPWQLLLRMGSCAILPAFLIWRSVTGVLPKKRFVREYVLSLPLLSALAFCHAAGELVGCFAGAGNSPQKLS